MFWYSFKEDTVDSSNINNYFQLYSVSPNFMNNFGDWLCIELLMFILGLLIIFFNQHHFLHKLIPKILYNTYIWNLPISIFLMNFINHFFYILASLSFRPFHSNTGRFNFFISLINFILVALMLNLFVRVLYLA